MARPAWADAAPPENPEAVIAEARADLHAAAAGLGARTLDDADIEAREAQIPVIEARLAGVLARLEPRLRDLQDRQTQFGAATPAAIPEDPRVTRTRQALAQSVASVAANVQEARLLVITADQVRANLSDRLRENFSARLWTQTRSILDPGLWRDFAVALPGDLARLARAVGAEADQSRPVGSAATDLALGLGSLAVCLFLLGPARVMLGRLGYRRALRGSVPTRLRRTGLALWLVLTATLTPLLAGLILRAVLSQINAMTPDVNRLTDLVIGAVVFAALLEGLGRALLSPRRPEWRLAPAPDAMVARLAPYPGLIGAAAALESVVAGLNSILGASLATRVATDCLTVLLELAAVGGALMAVGRARVEHRAMAGDGAPSQESDSRLPWILATLAAWLALAGALIAVLVGYLTLASFVMRETVWIGAILGMALLLLRMADDIFPALLAPTSPLGAALETALGLSHGAMEQIGVLLSGLVRLLVLLVACVAVLAPVGASFQDILSRFTATDFVVRMGLVSISPGAILGGIALFGVGLAITRAVRRWLEVRYLPKTNLDVGLRTSLAAGVGYLGALLATLVAFAYLGLSVAQIALVASALSVGIGFGLQAIVGNFVSGLILLAERPVRVGDWIAIGELEGDVRKINIRATEIEMADQSRLLVPNSDLVSKTVRNITHSGALGRVKIVIRVDAAADPGHVRDILLARLKDHPKILAEPAANVFLTDVRDGGMEFTAFAYLSSPRLAFGAKSDLLFQILPDLKAAGIALAGPATAVHIDLTAPSPSAIAP